jgi:hypothetical protein
MASAAVINKLFANATVEMFDHDPGTVNPLITSPDGGTTKRYRDMTNFEQFACEVMTTVIGGGGGGVTGVEIVATEDAAGTGLMTVVDSGLVQADAVGDFVALECSAAQVKEVGDAAGRRLIYIGVRVTCGHAGDEACVMYHRWQPRFAASGLTATTIS